MCAVEDVNLPDDVTMSFVESCTFMNVDIVGAPGVPVTGQDL